MSHKDVNYFIFTFFGGMLRKGKNFPIFHLNSNKNKKTPPSYTMKLSLTHSTLTSIDQDNNDKITINDKLF